MESVGSCVLLLAVLATASCTNSSEPEQCYMDMRVKNSTCILMNSTISVGVTYRTTDGKSRVTNIPLTSECQYKVNETNSFCNEHTDKKDFNETEIHVTFENITVDFTINAMADFKANQWNISNFTLGLDTLNFSGYFPDIFEHQYISGYIPVGSELFGTVDYNKYYLCNINRSFDLAVDSKNFSMTMYIADLMIQAIEFDSFNEDNETVFSNSFSHCYQDFNKDPAFIPIVVGSVIGGLVLVVLVAYIVGQFRSRRTNRGSYEKL